MKEITSAAGDTDQMVMVLQSLRSTLYWRGCLGSDRKTGCLCRLKGDAPVQNLLDLPESHLAHIVDLTSTRSQPDYASTSHPAKPAERAGKRWREEGAGDREIRKPHVRLGRVEKAQALLVRMVIRDAQPQLRLERRGPPHVLVCQKSETPTSEGANASNQVRIAGQRQASLRPPLQTVGYDPFIKSQPDSSAQLN